MSDLRCHFSFSFYVSAAPLSPLLFLNIVLLETKSSACHLQLSEKSIFQNLTVCCHDTIG